MKNHKRLLALGAAAVMTATLFAGCGPKENGGSANEPNSGAEGTDYKIAVVPKMTNIGWFQRMEDGVEAYNADNGTNYVYRVQGATADGSPAEVTLVWYGSKAPGDGWLEIEAHGGSGVHYRTIDEHDVPRAAQEALAASSAP